MSADSILERLAKPPKRRYLTEAEATVRQKAAAVQFSDALGIPEDKALRHLHSCFDLANGYMTPAQFEEQTHLKIRASRDWLEAAEKKRRIALKDLVSQLYEHGFSLEEIQAAWNGKEGYFERK